MKKSILKIKKTYNNRIPMTTIEQIGCGKTLSDRVLSMETKLNTLSKLIMERNDFIEKSHKHCKQRNSQNDKLNFIIDAYNNNYMRVIDEKLQQMQQLSSLESYLNTLIDKGNVEIDDINRVYARKDDLEKNMDATRKNIVHLQNLMALELSNLN